MYGALVWACRALKHQKRRFPARAENKFPWPLANRHACFATAAAALPALPNGQAEEEGLECGAPRWLVVEASTPHEAVARLGSSSSLVEWEFTNTILLEQAADGVVISVSSCFDIKVGLGRIVALHYLLILFIP